MATFEPNDKLVRLFSFGSCHLRCMEYCNGSSKDQSRPFASIWIGMVFPFDFHANVCNDCSRKEGVFPHPTFSCPIVFGDGEASLLFSPRLCMHPSSQGMSSCPRLKPSIRNQAAEKKLLGTMVPSPINVPDRRGHQFTTKLTRASLPWRRKAHPKRCAHVLRLSSSASFCKDEEKKDEG